MGYEVNLKHKFLILLTSSLVFSLVMILILVPSKAVYSGYSDWQYRKPITITEQSGRELKNYVILLNVSYENGKMNSDFSDLRFTYYNETSGEEIEIDYCLGKVCELWNDENGHYTINTLDGSYTDVAVRIPYIPANGQITIYMYYGNPSANDNSNDKIYFVEDFDETGDFVESDWTENGVDLIHDITNGYVYGTGQTGGYDDAIFNPFYVENVGVIADYRTQSTGTVPSVGFTFYKAVTTGETADRYYEMRCSGCAVGSYLHKVVGGTDTKFCSLPDYSSGWVTERMIFYPDGTIKITIGSNTYTCSDNTLRSGYFGFQFWQTDKTEYYDYVIVRPFTDPEPTYEIGEEETTGLQPPYFQSYSQTKGNTTEYFNFTINTTGPAWLWWNITDDEQVNFSTCQVKIRNWLRITDQPLLRYINDSLDPKMDADGWISYNCTFVEGYNNNQTIEIVVQLNHTYEYWAGVFPFEPSEATTYTTYPIYGNQYLMMELHNITTEPNTRYLISLWASRYSQTANTRDLNIFICNSSYTTGDPLNSPNCFLTHSINKYEQPNGENEFEYLLPLLLDGDGFIDGVKATPTMKIILKVSGVHSQVSGWNVYASNIPSTHTYISTDSGDTWNLAQYEANIFLLMANLEQDQHFQMNISIADNEGAYNTTTISIPWSTVNYPPDVAILYDDKIGGLLSIYDYNATLKIPENNLVWINATFYDPDLDDVSCSIYLLNPDMSLNTTLTSNQQLNNYYGICSYLLDTRTIDEGYYHVQINVSDGTLTEFDITPSEIRIIRNQQPEITIYSPTNTTYHTNQLLLNFTISDDFSSTFPVKVWLDGVLIYNTTAHHNNTYTTINLSPYVYQDKTYHIKVWANDTDTTFSLTAEKEVYFTAISVPNFVSIEVEPQSPQSYPLDEIWFNITISDFAHDQQNVILETDLAGSLQNYTLLNDTPTHFYYQWNIRPAVGTYTYKFYVNDTAGNWNMSNTYIYTINKGVSNLQLTSSQGWSIYVGTSTTISATAIPSTPHLEINGIEVDNPYSFLPQVGFYDVYAYIDDYENYTEWSKSATLTVLSLPTCVRNTTLAFERNVTVTNNIMLLNFTELVQEHYVKEDLSDVHIPSNTSNIWRNSTTLIVNATSLSTLTVRFGNYYTNISYPTHSLLSGDVVDMSTNYTQINPYALVNLRDELTATPLYPPGAELYGIVGCSLGESIFTIDNSTTSFLITSVEPITEISVRVKYSADAYYRRTRLFDNLTTIYVDIYVADAYEVALDRIDLIIADPDYYDAKCQIYRESAGHDIIVTEGYFDASHKLSVYLVEDTTYNIRVIDSNGNIVEYGDLVVVEPETKEIGGATLNLQPTSQLIANHLLLNAYLYENENITHIDYVDDLGRTNSITIYIFNSTSNLIYQNTYYNTSELHINISTPSPSSEVVFDIYHSIFGHVQSSIFVGRQETVETGVKQSYLDLISLFILLGVAGLISIRSLIGGAIVFDGLLILLKAVGWLSLPTSSIAFLIILSIIAIIIHLMRMGD